MCHLSREAILAAPDIMVEEVAVAEWGGVVRVRGLTGAERDAFEASVLDGPSMALRNLRARLIALAAVDAEGRRLFSDADVEALGNKSGAALDRLFAAAQRLSGLGEAELDTLAKKSGSGQSDESGSASRSPWEDAPSPSFSSE